MNVCSRLFLPSHISQSWTEGLSLFAYRKADLFPALPFFLFSYSILSLTHLPALSMQVLLTVPFAERKEKFRKSKKVTLLCSGLLFGWLWRGLRTRTRGPARTHTHPEVSGWVPRSQPSKRHNPRGEISSEGFFRRCCLAKKDHFFFFFLIPHPLVFCYYYSGGGEL